VISFLGLLKDDQGHHRRDAIKLRSFSVKPESFPRRGIYPRPRPDEQSKI